MSVNFQNDHPIYRNTVNRIKANEIVSPGFLDVRHPSDNSLSTVIYTGTLITDLAGVEPGVWKRSILVVEINTGNGRKWTKNSDRGSGWTFLDAAVAIAAPVSIINLRTAPCGWAIDDIRVDIEGEIRQEVFLGEPGVGNDHDYLALLMAVAVYDSDTKIHRIKYQVTAVGREM